MYNLKFIGKSIRAETPHPDDSVSRWRQRLMLTRRFHLRNEPFVRQIGFMTML